MHAAEEVAIEQAEQLKRRHILFAEDFREPVLAAVTNKQGTGRAQGHRQHIIDTKPNSFSCARKPHAICVVIIDEAHRGIPDERGVRYWEMRA